MTCYRSVLCHTHRGLESLFDYAIRLAFLYGDLGLNSETVAAILGIWIRCHRDLRALFIKLRGHVFGELTRKTFLSLAKLLGFTPARFILLPYETNGNDEGCAGSRVSAPRERRHYAME